MKNGYDEDDGFTWEKAINFIEHKLKTSDDEYCEGNIELNTLNTVMILTLGLELMKDIRKCQFLFSFNKIKR